MGESLLSRTYQTETCISVGGASPLEPGFTNKQQEEVPPLDKLVMHTR